MNREMWVGLLKDWGTAFVLAALVMAVWSRFAPAPVGAGAAPALELPNLDGGTFVLKDDPSAVTVVNFWATWCGPCRQEIPEFSRFAEAHPDVTVLGVSVDDKLDAPKLARAAEQLGVHYPVLHDRTLEVARAWGVSSFPTTFVLNAADEVVAVRVGALDQRELEALVGEVER
jgi:thiol-disulfide isomerase/thioredoxin